MSYHGALPEEIPSVNYEGSPVWDGPFLLTHSFCDCSFHGACEAVNDSLTGLSKRICRCDPGWTGLSDFMDARGASCHINIEAVRWLWVVNLILWGLVLFVSVPKLYNLFSKHLESKRKMRTNGKAFHIWNNKGLFSAVIGLTVAAPGMMLVGILRLAYPESRVGLDAVISVLWFWGRMGIGLSTAVHQPALMRQMMRAQSSADHLVRDYERYGQLLTAIQTLAGLWVLPVLITRGQDISLSRACFACFCGQVMVSFVLFSHQAYSIRKVLYKILTESAQASPTRNLLAVRDRLCSIQLFIQKQTMIQTVFYLTFTVAPPVWLLYDYLLPISWITPPLMFMNVVSGLYNEAFRSKDWNPGGHSTAAYAKTKTAHIVTAGAIDDQRPGGSPNERTFQNGDKDSESWNQTSMYPGEMSHVVEVADVNDDLLTATGHQFNRLNILRTIAGLKPSSGNRSSDSNSSGGQKRTSGNRWSSKETPPPQQATSASSVSGNLSAPEL